ncbi:hypothetical protein M0L20_05815 [Spirosoma sp. RP8]|uniref:DUF4369 domain-containing protein n=1 Tax=Spirosoma liriopis TaxID=2937440 RepID=A0ABT0HIF4_9BACT|nr:hypothetical protein [Spirosoma liriopis]MCK8491360.1 hypothetical protein [Spirosoma liriopis]
MKKYVLLAIVWLIAVETQAIAKNTWNRGELSLINGTVLTGDLSYNWRAEIVQYRDGNTIKAFSALQVREFKYFDVDQNTLRKFIVADQPDKSSRHRLFLEEFGVGSMMIYRQLRHARDPIHIGNPMNTSIDDKSPKSLDRYVYYIYEGDQMTSLTDFNTELWPRMKAEFDDELTHYSATIQANFSSTLTRLLLIAQYNQLKARANQLTISHSDLQPTSLD